MSKPSNPRRQADNEAKATARMLRVSPQKLNLLAQLIRGKKVSAALADLEFSRKRISTEVRKALESAIANAENNHDLDVDDLVVGEAFVGRAMVMLANGFSMRPARPRARGLKRFSTMSLPTQAWATTRSSTSRSWLFSALAIADSSVFLTSTEILFLENSRSASAVATFLPRMSWASRLSFCVLTRSMRVVALASFSACRRGFDGLDIGV